MFLSHISWPVNVDSQSVFRQSSVQLHLGPDLALSHSNMTNSATSHHRRSSFLIPSEVVWLQHDKQLKVKYVETMGEYEEIVVLETPAGQEFRTRKVSVGETKTGLRLKLPKEYSTYAISK